MKCIKAAAIATLFAAATANAADVAYLECNYKNGDNTPLKILVAVDESTQSVTHTYTNSGVVKRAKAVFTPAEVSYKTDSASVHKIDRTTLAYKRTFNIGGKISTDTGTCEVIETPKERKF